MQDEINEKVIALSIRTTKLTAEMLQKSIRFMLSQIKKQLDKPVQHHGKQTLKQLMKQNAGVSSTHEKTGRGGHHRLPRPVLFFCLFLADFCYADPADI